MKLWRPKVPQSATSKSDNLFQRCWMPDTQDPWGPRAEDGCFNLSRERTCPSPHLHHFVVFRPQTIGWCSSALMRMTFTQATIQMFISPEDTLTDTPRNQALPGIWASLSPVKLTHQISHCRWGSSLVVQWLGCYPSTARGTGSIPSWGTKISQGAWCSQKK